MKKRFALDAAVTVTDSIDVTVSRAPVWAIAGFKAAVARFRAAEAAGASDEAHHAVFEALAWLDSLASANDHLIGDVTVKALTFARARSHHHLASVIELRDGSTAWLWRRSSIWPFDPNYENEAGKRAYESVLSGKPVLAELEAAERAVERAFAP
jgi:hypothetical protein